MIRLQSKKSKSAQYLVGGIIAVIVLIAWISLPLMSNSSLDSSSSYGNLFKSRVSDIGALGSGIPSEGGAPGSPLSGEMTDNPATSGESLASSLFQSGLDMDDARAADKSASADIPAPDMPGKFSAPAPARGPGAGGAKLIPQASITAGNSGSMSTGGAHNKFFGSKNAKTDIAPAGDLNANAGRDSGRNALVAMLGDAADKSRLAAKTGDINAASGGAASAFGKSAKTGGSNLNTGLENGAAYSGLALGQAAQDLKTNDPNLSSNKTQLPEPEVAKVDTSEEEMKQMIIQMVLNATLGQMFGAVGQAMATAINPNYKE